MCELNLFGEMTGTSLEEWLMSRGIFRSSQWFKNDKDFTVYIRKPNIYKNAITVANICAKDRADNVEFNPKISSRGNLKSLIETLIATGRRIGAETVAFESVMTTWLRDKLKEYGFHIVRDRPDLVINISYEVSCEDKN